MPRRPKPYKYRGWYVTDSGGVPHHKLSPIELGMVEAEKELRRYLNRLDDEREKNPTAGPGIRPPAAIPADTPYGKKIHEAHDEFLDAKRADGEPLTYKHYVDKLLPFYDRFGARAVASITETDGIAYKNYLMNEKVWKKGKEKMKGLGPCSVNHHLRAAKTLLNWCAKPSRRLITHNPWADIKYLKEHGRERLITDQEFAVLLRHCDCCQHLSKPGHDKLACARCRGCDDFRQMLIVMRHTTMRPGELRKLEWDEGGTGEPPLRPCRQGRLRRAAAGLSPLLPEVRRRCWRHAGGSPWQSTAAKPKRLVFHAPGQEQDCIGSVSASAGCGRVP